MAPACSLGRVVRHMVPVTALAAPALAFLLACTLACVFTPAAPAHAGATPPLSAAAVAPRAAALDDDPALPAAHTPSPDNATTGALTLNDAGRMAPGATLSACPNTGTDLGASPWLAVEPGLCLARFYSASPPATIVALRAEPGHFRFSLHMASHEGKRPKALVQWAAEQDLVAAINASMYLPDVRTSTGYMRGAGHVNNTRMGGRLGAFFVAEPLDPALPAARLLERDSEPDMRATLERYQIVVQNFRLIGAGKRIFWPQGGAATSIAAVAQDKAGRIIFLHCREPITPHDFARLLLDAPLNITTAMYVEGGVEAGMLLRERGPQARTHLWTGRRKMPFLSGGETPALLPNVLGIRRREAPSNNQ